MLKKCGVGQVAIEGIDDPVPVLPHMRQRMIGVFASGVCIVDDIQPEAAPLFAIVWAFEEAVDDAFPGTGAFVSEKGIHFLRRWWQAGEVIGCATDEGEAVSFSRCVDFRRCETLVDKGIDRIDRWTFADFWYGWALRR